MPTPTAKSASISVTTCSLANSTSLASVGSPETIVAPNSQNHEIARIGIRSARRLTTCTTTDTESRIKCGRVAPRSGAGGAAGMARAVKAPSVAAVIPQTPTTSAPLATRTTLPPRMVPSRIARNVPASMSALPATSSSSRRCCGSSSSSRRCCGSSAYLMGPKTVECVPRQNSAPSSAGTLCCQSPHAPSAMIAISAIFTQRAIAALSVRSASVPDAPEKRKNGAMKRPPASITSDEAATCSCSAIR